MKKLIALVLSLVMVMGLATTAFAEEAGDTTLNKTNGYSYDIKVEGEYIEELLSDEIISVDVEWGAMNFTYAATQQGTWQPDSHTYSNATEEAAWVGDTTSDITVTNHSNVDVTASFEFKAETGFDKVTGKFTQPDTEAAEEGENRKEVSSVELDKGVENKPKEADNETVTFEIGGELESTTTTLTKIGTITVSVKKTETTSDNG